MDNHTPPPTPVPAPDNALPVPRRVLYVVSRFPCISTTFTTNEMAAIAAEGVDVWVAPIWPPQAGHTPHAVEVPFLSKIVRTNLLALQTWLMIGMALLRHPLAVLTLLRLVPGHLQSIYQLLKLGAAIPPGLYLGRWCETHGVEHIHSHFLSTPTTVALIASAVSGVPFSFTAHAFDITSQHPQHVSGSKSYKCRRAMFGVTISHFNRRYMQANWRGIDRTRIEVLYNGIDTSLFTPAGEADQPARGADAPVRILSVSRLAEKKGFEYLIRAVAQLRTAGREVRLDIYGDGPLHATLQALIDELGQNDGITLHGPIGQNELATRYQEADLFALASVPLEHGDMDGLPTVLIEALAAGLPAVSTQVSGIPEIIRHEETGLCVPPRDVDALAAALARLIDDPAAARAMGQRGREVVLAEFDRRNNAQRLLDMWRAAHARPAANAGTSPGLHILYLHQHFATRQGASGTRSYEFARLLLQREHTVTMLCGRSHRAGLPPETGDMVETYDIDGINVLALNIPYHQDMSYFRRILAFVWFMLLATWVALRQRQIDVIFATSTPLTIAVPAMVASFINRKPFVFEVRDLWPEVPIKLGILTNPVLIFLARVLERVAYRRAHHIVALSPGVHEAIVRSGIAPDKITVIPNSSDMDLFSAPPEAAAAFRAQHPALGERPIVLYAGAYGVVNWLDYFIDLAQRVGEHDPDIAFVMMGMGSEETRLRALAEQRGVLGRNLWMLDPVSKSDMPGVLAAAALATSTVVPNPVMWANSANKFFDALASGTPVAINHEGWQADVLRETGAGIVLDAHDMDQAAKDLIAVLHDAERLAQMAQAAHQLAEDCFARSKLTEQLDAVLTEAVRRY